MTTFLVIGDLHIHITNLDESQLLMDTLISIAAKTRPDLIVVLGDVLHTNSVIKADAHVLAVELLFKLSQIAPLLVLMGNHDVPGPLSYFSPVHGFTALKFWQGTKRDNVQFPSNTGVQIVDTEVVLFSVNDVQFCALPYIPPGRFQEALATCPDWKSCKIVFCHQEFANCDLGFGHLSECIDKWSKDLPQVISGHIHKYQKLDNILYCGTPRQVNITEEPYKTVSLIKYTNAIEETRFSTGLPARIHLKINVKDIMTVEVPESGRVRIEITGDVCENIVARKSLKIRDWRKKGFVVKFHNIVFDSDRETEIESEDAPVASFKELCRIAAYEEGLQDEYIEIFS